MANVFGYYSQTDKLLIQLRDPKRHGIIDGGHMFRALQTVAKDR